jgi:hypothetical protein
MKIWLLCLVYDYYCGLELSAYIPLACLDGILVGFGSYQRGSCLQKHPVCKSFG